MRLSTTFPTSPARVRPTGDRQSTRDKDGEKRKESHVIERGLLAEVHASVLHHAERPCRNPTPAGQCSITGREAMKKKTSGGFSKTTGSCMQETVLRQLVKVAALHEMTMWRNKNKEWHLSVTVTSGPHVLYLSTRRACPGPLRALRRRSPRASGFAPPPAGHARAPLSEQTNT